MQEIMKNAKAWPFIEARKILERYKKAPPAKGYVLFQTGYGPSGLPHIGTFGEVARTSMVRHAFEQLSDIPTKLICFSDDMDGFRKVPTNLPNQEMLAQHLNKPLTAVPDPFGTHESFAHHNNARLKAFLDSYGFVYEFRSATECYQSGMFDEALLAMLRAYEKVMAIMLPTLREERRATYSPFLPICPSTGQVLQVPLTGYDAEAGTISFIDGAGKAQTQKVTGGRCKMQWKPDWALRWHAFGVDYEMAGKDLIDSVKQASKIVRALGSMPPAGFNYELFLDDQGQKISKSKGNGLTIDEWLRYAPEESLALFMYQKPQTAKRLFFDVIPKAVDEYISFAKKYPSMDAEERIENPVWHIHEGNPPEIKMDLSFALLLNLAAAANAHDKEVMWGFIQRYLPEATPEAYPFLDKMTNYAVRYYQDFIAPNKKYRMAEGNEIQALKELKAFLDHAENPTAEEIQNEIYALGKKYKFEPLRDWFKALYEILLGQSQGPRMGSFIALYGTKETAQLIDKALRGELLIES